MAITLTERAAERVKKFMSTRENAVGVRLGVRSYGCSGMAYVMDFIDAVNPGDQVFEDRGVKLIVDSEHMSILDGTQVDFVRQGLNEAFKFDNPNVKAACGCGESFTV